MSLRVELSPGEKPGETRVMFEKLKHLPQPLRFSFSCAVSKESNLTLDVTDSKTDKCAKIILDEKSFSECLHLGDISRRKWRQQVPLILNVFERVYRKLEAAIEFAEVHKNQFSAKPFIAEDQILAVAGKISKVLLFGRSRHFTAEESGLPIGMHVRRGKTLDDCLVFLNFKKAELLGEGKGRRVKPCFEMMNTMLCSKGTWKGADNEEIARESKILMSLRNTPGVIHTYATIVKTDGSYVVYQKHFPMNLRDASEMEIFKSSERNKLKVLEQVLEGLVGIHAWGTHGDMKLKNIVIDDQMKTAIIDFGAFHPHGLSTLFFLGNSNPPPEWTKLSNISPSFDIWRLGIAFYALYVGEFPSETSLRGQEQLKWLTEVKSGWLKMGKEIPPKVAELITKMTEPDPKKRFTAQQALDFIRDPKPLSEEKKV